MKVLFRAFLLLIAFLVALSILKFFFIKVFIFGLWVAAIAFVLYVLSAILKKA